MGTSARMALPMELKAYEKRLLEASKQGPLQSLTDQELNVNGTPMTVYPPGIAKAVRAWVRFGATPFEVRAYIVRSTPNAAGIEFSIDEKQYRCWVWGNAVRVSEEDQQR